MLRIFRNHAKAGGNGENKLPPVVTEGSCLLEQDINSLEFRAKALPAMADFASKVTVLVLDRMKRTAPYFVVTIQSWVKRVLWGSSGQAGHSSRFRKAN